MLIVAPRGRTKAETSFDTPSFSSHNFIVTGRVAPLELDEKAKICAGKMPRKNLSIVMLENNFKTIG